MFTCNDSFKITLLIKKKKANNMVLVNLFENLLQEK